MGCLSPLFYSMSVSFMYFFVTFLAEALHFLQTKFVVNEQVANRASFRIFKRRITELQ